MFFLKKKVLKKFNCCPFCKSINIEKKEHYVDANELSDYTKNALLGAGKGATKFGLNGMGAPIGAAVGFAAGIFKTIISNDMKEVNEYYCNDCNKYFKTPDEIEKYVRE